LLPSQKVPVFDEPGYEEAARKVAQFILENMRSPDGRLLHRYRDGQAAIQANIDDYAFLIWGLIELYEATFNSVAMLNLLRLGRITGNTDFEGRAEKINSIFSDQVKRAPSVHTQLMVALDFAVGHSKGSGNCWQFSERRYKKYGKGCQRGIPSR